MMKLFSVLIVVGFPVIFSAHAQEKKPVFIEVPPKLSGLEFINQINEDDSLHIFKYEYLYNGHGMGVADFNHDGLEDLFIAGNVVSNKLYLNKGNLKFEDVTRKAGVMGNGAWRTGVSIADVNGDTWPDIYICHSGPKPGEALSNELYIHQGLKDGVPIFREMAKKYGLDAPGTLSTQAAFFDFDLDGDLDMFLVNHSNHTFNPYLNTSVIRSIPSPEFGNRLFRNDQSATNPYQFTDVTQKAGITNNALNFGLSVVVSDLNKDGWPDLYTSSDYTEQDNCYINQKNGTFRQVLQQSFTHISKFSMGADIADFNNDGWPDVFTLDMLPEDNYRQKLLKGPDEYDAYNLLLDSGYYHQQMRNMLHMNRGMDPFGQLRFAEIGQLSGISNTDWSWSALFMDFDNDGWKDLLVTNGYLRDYTDNDFLKYTVADAQLKEAAKGNLQFKTYDLVRQMPSNKLKNYLFRNNRDLTFSNVSDDWGFQKKTISNCAVYADFDNDGDMDLVIGNNNEPVQLFENKLSHNPKQSFLQIKLSGIQKNTAAFGSKVYLYTSDSSHPVQYQELFPVRGYQSSVSTVIHFGLGAEIKVDSLRVEWNGGGDTVIYSPAVNKSMHIRQHDQRMVKASKDGNSYLFEDITKQSGLNFRHEENEFVDFKVEVLLPYQFSKMGPALATGDVNGDDLEDVFIGGAVGQAGQLYIQLPGSKFIKATVQPWQEDLLSEDVKAIIKDLNGDGHNDLYVVTGGNEYEADAPEYKDRIYINDGNGNFSKVSNALPDDMRNSKNAVAAADIDKDGDLDLFIGGGCMPGSFPSSGRSYVLRNDSRESMVKFTDVTASWSGELLHPGIIHEVKFFDIDKDGREDLLLAGEWTTLKIFRNTGNAFLNVTEKYTMKESGIWSSLLIDDINGDGHADIIAGNVGNNLPFKATPGFPLSLTVTDLDDNGAAEVLFSYFIQGKLYPAASRDELLDQVVPLRKKFIKYHQYATVELTDLVPPAKMNEAGKLSVSEIRHIAYMSDGKGNYTPQALPVLSQSSRIFAASSLQIGGNKKGYLLAGNFYPWRTQWGRNDSGLGNLLTFENNEFKLAENSRIGLFMDGDIRDMAIIRNSDDHQLVIVVRNNGPVQVLKTLNR